MQKWEYVVATTQAGDGRIRWINGQEVRDWKKSSHWIDALNQFGDEGWELVQQEGSTLTFKRPKA